MNSPSALIGTTVEQASQVINGWGFMITPEALSEIAKDVGEASILSRAGGHLPLRWVWRISSPKSLTVGP